jgi:ERCC4-type nuclease
VLPLLSDADAWSTRSVDRPRRRCRQPTQEPGFPAGVPGPLTVAVDTREKYGWRFAGRSVTLERRALSGGDYAAVIDGTVIGVVERKTLENLATSLSDGTLAFQMQRLAEAGRAAIVVEGDYPDLFRTQPGRGSWLADKLGRLAVRYPEVPIVFAGSRRFAEEWAYRFFGAAVGDAMGTAETASSGEPP